MQAKANASKYTGVSSEDRSGGFGAKSSGFGSSTASSFGLSGKYSGGGLGSSGLGSTGGLGSSSKSSSYHDFDEPYDSVSSLWLTSHLNC